MVRWCYRLIRSARSPAGQRSSIGVTRAVARGGLRNESSAKSAGGGDGLSNRARQGTRRRVLLAAPDMQSYWRIKIGVAKGTG